MNTTSENSAIRDSDAIESLLEKAEPRPAPPPQMARDVRVAVQAEWLAVSGRRRRWRNLTVVATAASILLAVVFALTSLQHTDVAAIEVALLDQSKGTIRLYGSESEATEGDAISTMFAGQVLQTGRDSAAGLAWSGGGSLRVDAHTRIELVSASEIFLYTGRVYFDSFGTTDGGTFAVRTELGLVSHIGTQYMAEVSDSGLAVSVREGEVIVSGAASDEPVHRGQRAELNGARRPVITNTSGVGDDWKWVETVSPNISVDDMSAYDFLQWVGRETGYTVHFTSESANATARATELMGVVNADPRDELRLRMMTMDLDAQFDRDTSFIHVSEQMAEK